MDNDFSKFMRNMSEPFTLTVGGRQIVIDALFSMNRMEQYLDFTDVGDDHKTAVAKLAYAIYKENNDGALTFCESDFLNLTKDELAGFAVVLYKQIIDSDKEPEIYNGDDIFEAVYERSNSLRVQMAETTRKLIAPFLKTNKQISKIQKPFGAALQIDNMISKHGIGNITATIDIANRVNLQHSAFHNAIHDMGGLSSALSQALGENLIETRLALPQSTTFDDNLFGIREIAAIGNKVNQFVNTMISPGVITALQVAASRIEEIINPLGNVITSISENFFNPLRELWTTIDFDEIHRSLLEKERKGIEQVLFETKWFMFSADIAVGSFVLDVVDVLQNKRIKNYSKHIDAIVFKYVTIDVVDDIGRDWKARKLPKHIKRILRESIKAYKGRQYATTAIVLSNLWQGIIADLNENTEGRTDKKTKEQFAHLISTENASEVTAQFLNNYIWGDCYSVDDVIDGIPGRHAIAHGWLMDLKYPSRKESLNAILFTHFLISCYAYEDE